MSKYLLVIGLNLVLGLNVVVSADINFEQNNYYPTTITSGVDEQELAQGLAVSLAAGAHQFDHGTFDWQASITGAWFDDESAISFSGAKRWESMPGLLHLGYTENGENGAIVIGWTGRF